MVWHAGKEIVKDELLGQPVEGEHREHRIAELKQQRPARAQEGRQRGDERTVVGDVWNDPECHHGIELAHALTLARDCGHVLRVKEHQAGGIDAVAREILLAQTDHLWRHVVAGDADAKFTVDAYQRRGLARAELVHRVCAALAQQPNDQLEPEEVRRVLGVGPELLGVVLVVVAGRAAVVVRCDAHGVVLLGAVSRTRSCSSSSSIRAWMVCSSVSQSSAMSRTECWPSQ